MIECVFQVNRCYLVTVPSGGVRIPLCDVNIAVVRLLSAAMMIWSITSGIIVCCTLYGVLCAVGGGKIGATGVGVGSGFMMLACVLSVLGTFVTCSSLLQ